MKKFIISIICALLLLVISYKSNYISDFIAKKITGNQEVIIKEKNEYAKNDNFIFIQNTDSFVPYSYNDLLKIIYTTINYGWDFFTFYCPSEYEKYPESKILKRAIGYKEIIKYLNGEIQLNEAIELIKKNTRHYVKRQYTWFNNQLPVNWFNTNFEDFSQTENEVINFIQTKNKD